MDTSTNKIFEYAGFDCEILIGRYANNATALRIIAAETERNQLLGVFPGEPIAVTTVNANDCKLGKNEVLIKDWSENEGMADALAKAGVVELTGELHKFSHTVGKIAKLNPAFA